MHNKLRLLINGEEENQKCCDCGDRIIDPWVSLNHAIFICINCSGVHRSFGTHISFVRSCSLDSWTEDQIERMTLGGNMKFKYFLEKYNLKNYNINDKYKTKAVKFYRDNLDKIASGEDLEEPPSIEDGKEILEFKSSFNNDSMSGFGSDDLFRKERKEETTFKDKMISSKRKIEEWGMNMGTKFSQFMDNMSKDKKKNQNNINNSETGNQIPKEDNDYRIEEENKKTKSDNNVDSFKKGVGVLGSKLSWGWNKFSNKTKELATNSKKYIESQFNSTTSESNNQVSNRNLGNSRIQQAPRNDYATNNSIEENKEDNNIYERKGPEFKPPKKDEPEEVNYI